jgi:hypothetical protein
MLNLHPKPLAFPRWVEALIIALLALMTGVEFIHGQIFWSFIFGTAALCFGISLLARILKGDHDGPP